MEYTKLGKTELSLSRFGLGCMRFPEEEQKGIDIIHYALDNGVTHLDTAYMYKNSQSTIGKALVKKNRDKIILSSKSPSWFIESHQDFEKYLDEELRLLKTDYIDIYLLHNLFEANFNRVMKHDPFTFLENMKKKGKIRHNGFSLHGTYNDLVKCVDVWDKWDAVLLQVNILDAEKPIGLKGVQYAKEQGLGVIIMEPLRGGTILNHCPESVQKLVSENPQKRTLAEWCFRWLYDKSEIDGILSGVADLAHLKANLEIFKNSAPSVLTSEDEAFIARIREEFLSVKTIACTECGYCMPCKSGVDIPEVFRIFNKYAATGKMVTDKMNYTQGFVNHGSGADKCTDCGDCLELCPQELQIPQLLQDITKELGLSKPAFTHAKRL